MTLAHPSQMTLNLEPALVDRFPTLRSYVAYRVQTNAKFMDTPEARQARAISKLEGMLPELSALLASVKGAG